MGGEGNEGEWNWAGSREEEGQEGKMETNGEWEGGNGVENKMGREGEFRSRMKLKLWRKKLKKEEQGNMEER